MFAKRKTTSGEKMKNVVGNLPSRGVNHFPLPPAVNRLAVSRDTWILFFSPVDSIRDATEILCEPQHLAFLWTVILANLPVFIVSPKSWNRPFSPRRTPAVTGPE